MRIHLVHDRFERDRRRARRITAEDAPGGVFRFLHVGLVERLDAEDGPGDRGSELPAEELASEPRRFEPQHRVARTLEFGGLRRVAVANERPVVAVDVCGERLFAVDGDDSAAFLAG